MFQETTTTSLGPITQKDPTFANINDGLFLRVPTDKARLHGSDSFPKFTYKWTLYTKFNKYNPNNIAILNYTISGTIGVNCFTNNEIINMNYLWKANS